MSADAGDDDAQGSASGDLPAPREVAAAVVRRAGRVLVQTRTDSWRGYWEFPGGGREPGESLEECVVRECVEELDLLVRVESVLHRLDWSYPGRRVHVVFFACGVDPDREPSACLGQDLAWVRPDELAALRMLPSNAAVIELLSGRGPDEAP